MENEVNEITINNCNNVSAAKIKVHRNCLNIKFAPNGTGKSTIAKATYFAGNEKSLSELHSYGSKENPSFSSDKPLGKVLIFDEDFVNTFVFIENEVIGKSFEIFIKTPSYDERLQIVNNRLRDLKIDIGKDDELVSLLSTFTDLTTKIQFNNDRTIKNNPFFKSLISKQHLRKIPQNLQKFKPFFETTYTVEWVDWKNKGFEFDESGKCPFCTEKFVPDYQKEKETFTSTYSKASVKNLKDFLDYFKTLEEYLTVDKNQLLNDCITSITDEHQIRIIITQFMLDIEYLKSQLSEIVNFDSYRIESEEISKLGNKLIEMKINPKVLNMICSKKTLDIIGRVNAKIDSLLKEANEVKKEIGALKGVIQALANSAKKDINGFLESAGINYELVIEVISENDSRTILKYKDRQRNNFEVEKIKKHLSWGERNAFALVLFMHYSISQNPNLIILDDPISSFDSDKKYAIINRLFKKHGTGRSFYRQTVLMMTHDLEPVIDFVVNNQPTGASVCAYHLQNKDGIVTENVITHDDVMSQIHLLASTVTDEKINKILRIIALRKYIELTEPGEDKSHAYNICSCVLHSKKTPDKKVNQECIPMKDEEIALGTGYIKKWIPDFSYESMIKNSMTIECLVKSYTSETSNYFRLQIFRIILNLDDNRAKIMDDNLLNHIDQTYHVENDYVYNLDFRKFEMVPEFIIKKCDEFVANHYE